MNNPTLQKIYEGVMEFLQEADQLDTFDASVLGEYLELMQHIRNECGIRKMKHQPGRHEALAGIQEFLASRGVKK